MNCLHRIQVPLNTLKYFGMRKLYWVVIRLAQQSGQLLSDIVLSALSPSHQLIKRRISRLLIDTYNGDGGQNTDINQMFLGFGLIHYALIRNTKPKHILCVGSRKGYIPAILALACKENGIGSVDFVDAGYDETDPKHHWSGIGFWKKNDSFRHFNKLGVAKFINTHIMTTKEFASLYPHKTFQYVYIDGDHSFKGVTLDYQLFWPRVQKFGFMVFHDVVAKGFLDKGKFGVWKFWKKIQSDHKVLLPFPISSGLGILQKQ